jgi:hypothetical protein
LENHFGWMGIVAAAGGLVLYVVTRLTGLAPTPWFYPIASAMLVLLGTQLFTSWMLVRVLSTLSEREARKLRDLNGTTATATPTPERSPGNPSTVVAN